MGATELYYFPGQKATVFLETLDGYGMRADGYTVPDGYPFITRVIFPDLSLASGFPQNMIKLDVGLYFFQFTLPATASAVGSYAVDGYYRIPGSNPASYLNKLWQIIVTAPFGNFGTTIG